MRIALLSHNAKPYSQKRLMTAGAKRGHQMQFIHISNCYMNISSGAPIVYYRSNETIEPLDAIIPRINPMHTFYGTAVLRQFERMGIYSLNPSLGIIWSRDKLRALQHLARKKIPMPITGIADSPQESEKLIDVVGGAPLVVRLLEGTLYKGTVFAETHLAAVSVINAFKQLKTNILVQEYIEESKGEDIRCVVIGKEVIAAVIRRPKEKSFHHKSDPFDVEPVTLSAAEKKIAIQASNAMKLNFASVDLIRAARGPLLLDIDCSPNIEVLEQATQIDIASLLFSFIEAEANARD